MGTIWNVQIHRGLDLCCAFTDLTSQDTGMVHSRQTAGMVERPGLCRAVLHSAALCSGGFPSRTLLSFPHKYPDSQACDQVMCSLNPSNFASCTIFWILDGRPHFLAVWFLTRRWMCFHFWVWGTSVMKGGGEGYGVGVSTCASEHQMHSLSSLSISHWGCDTHPHLESIQWYVCYLQKSINLLGSASHCSWASSEFAQLDEHKRLKKTPSFQPCYKTLRHSIVYPYLIFTHRKGNLLLFILGMG